MRDMCCKANEQLLNVRSASTNEQQMIMEGM